MSDGERPVPDRVADALLAECLGRPQAYDALRRLCDTVGGRTSGAASGQRAEEWAAELMADWGLDAVHGEALPVGVWERGKLDARVLGDPEWRLTALAHGFAPDRCDVTAPVLDVGHGLPEDYERLKDLARDSIALCVEGAPEGRRAPHRTEKLAWAIAHGAAGLMIVGPDYGSLPRTGVCHRSGSPIPSLGISREDGERLQRMLRDGLRPRARIVMRNRIGDSTARNIIGEITGHTEPGQIVVAGAHLDSWDVSQGATDNGLGCAIVLEAARALVRLGLRPRRTIRFALWAAEETGLHGSRAYVSDHADELDRTVCVMNFDMTGDPHGYWTPGNETVPEMLRGLARQLAPLGMREEFSAKPGLHSDHQPFMLAGVPVVCLAATLPAGGGGAYYHSTADTFEKVSQPALCRAAAVAAHTLWAFAECAEPPYSRKTPAEVDAMIEAAGLREAILD